MNHLACGMDAGIGATCGEGLNRSVRIELRNGRFQLSLHAVAIALTLPATKRRTLVLQAEGNPTKGR